MEITFFQKTTNIGRSDIVSVKNSNYLQLDITGSASVFKINVYAQVVEGGDFLPLAVIGNTNFKIYNWITTNGFYRIDTSGILNIQLELSEISGGDLTCLGKTVSIYNGSVSADWKQEDDEQADYIKNKPPINSGEDRNTIIEGEDTQAISYGSHAGGARTIAGGKGYEIIGISDPVFGSDGMITGTYTLSSVEGLEVGMIYSVKFVSGARYHAGAILGINGLDVRVENYVTGDMGNADDPENYGVENYFTIVGRPDLGDVHIGFNAFSIGENCIAQDIDSSSEGRGNISAGPFSHTEGRDNIAGYAAHGEGRGNIAKGNMSHAEGFNTQATRNASHAEGQNTQATATSAHAEGNTTVASGESAHAEGSDTKAEGRSSHAEGGMTVASGHYAHSEGGSTNAEGNFAHSEGSATVASGTCAHTEGNETQAIGESSHAEGYLTVASGNYAHSEGNNTQATNWGTHAEGINTVASGDYGHAEGSETKAAGAYSHAEGQTTRASGVASHVEGIGAYANGTASHAEGNNTTASGAYAHSEGNNTTAEGLGSHAEGYGTHAKSEVSHAEGYNTEALANYAHSEGYATHATGSVSHAEGNNTTASGEFAHSEGNNTTAEGYAAHAEGNSTKATGKHSHAEGQNTQATAQSSHAEGENTQATAPYAHAEGNTTKAMGNQSHAEGFNTQAIGLSAHAEGGSTIASGNRAHAEGESTIASGAYQHVGGKFNIADTNNKYAHIVGNGTSNDKRSNAYTLDWDGNAKYAGSVTAGREIINDDGNLTLVTKGDLKELAKMHWQHYQEPKASSNSYYAGRTDYTAALNGRRASYFYPRYDIKPTTAFGFARDMIGETIDLVERLSECGVTMDFSQCANVYYLFYNAKFSRIPELDLRAATLPSVSTLLFGSTTHTIDKILIKDDGSQSFESTFTYAYGLKNIEIEGVIGALNNVHLKNSTKLTFESAKNFINALEDVSADTEKKLKYSINFSSETLALLDADGNNSPNGNTWREYINDKGWNC